MSKPKPIGDRGFCSTRPKPKATTLARKLLDYRRCAPTVQARLELAARLARAVLREEREAKKQAQAGR